MVKTEIVSKIQSDPSSSSSVARNKKKYKGVRMRSWGSWVSEIRAPNQKTRIWLGSYSTAEAAARAYDAALLCLKGSSANLNFPLSQSPFIPDTTMSPKSIQRVAAAAANASHHHTLEDNATIEANGGAASATTTTTTTTALFSPPLSSTSSTNSSPTSPSPSTSSSNQNDDIDIAYSTNSSLPYCPSYTTNITSATYDDGHYTEELMLRPSMDPWIDLGDLQSPKYMDHVLNANAMFNMPSIEDFYEGGDLSLWSFC